MRPFSSYVQLLVCGVVMLSACGRSRPMEPDVDAGQGPIAPDVDASQGPMAPPDIDASQGPAEPDADAGEAPVDANVAASVGALTLGGEG